ncbi:hypothetical protein L4X63_09615 [Geomonas sp. Red32]|uniref:hypothetical protein n=1 Tax=Geomonas sp. Red32 TaxID=2912856 RepID=UPI00202CEB40|nr:hypothetical protein [Geomonas sp. Red32]MCM0081846.1 hypothetical protein [Geomonas sp. Red32]
MHLVQILLPLYDNAGQPFPHHLYLQIRDELSERFGGITTYMRSPARGLWKERQDTTVHDDIVIYEVMVRELDRDWWREYREMLTATFRQAVMIVRATEVELL